MQYIKIRLINWLYKIETISQKSTLYMFSICLCLSWLYALSSQCCIPLSFNLVPITLSTITFMFCAWLLGKTAIYSYILYLIQGTAGLPFFSRFGSGITHLLGPTGGYLIGFLFAMIFMTATKCLLSESKIVLLIKYWIACLIYFSFGIAQLSFFVPAGKILTFGFYPFFVGDFIIKAFFMLFLASLFKKQNL